MVDVFKKNLDDGILPGLKFCAEIQQRYKVLENRNPATIKAWVNNMLRKKK